MLFSSLVLGGLLSITAHAAAEPVALRLSTFNTWHGMGPSGVASYAPLENPHRFEARRLEQLAVVAAEEPDVAFLQEVNPLPERAQAWGRALDARVGWQRDAAGLKLFGFGVPRAMNAGLALAVGHRYPSRSLGAIPLSHRGPNLLRRHVSLQIREERFALFAEMELPDGRRVLLVDVHLHDGFELVRKDHVRITHLLRDLHVGGAAEGKVWARVTAGNRRRAREVERLLARVSELDPRYDAVVIAGDFNATPDGEVHQRLQSAGFLDAWGEAHAGEAGWSYDLEANLANRACQSELALPIDLARLDVPAAALETLRELVREAEDRSRRIDYIWIKTRAGVPKVRAAHLFGQPAGGRWAASDHFGVSAVVEF